MQLSSLDCHRSQFLLLAINKGFQRGNCQNTNHCRQGSREQGREKTIYLNKLVNLFFESPFLFSALTSLLTMATLVRQIAVCTITTVPRRWSKLNCIARSSTMYNERLLGMSQDKQGLY